VNAQVSPAAPSSGSGRYPDRHLALVGLMGAGKTSVGRACARRLDRLFVDTDEIVETSSGRSIAEIFAHDGEAAFRALERVAVAQTCAASTPTVIACGGGAVLDAENRRILRASCCVVWLRVAPAALAVRIGAGAGRPLLSGRRSTGPVVPAVPVGTVVVPAVPVSAADPGESVEARLVALASVRAPLYEAAAHVVLDTDGCSIEEAALGVLDAFTRWVP
jgi:shikimate kinase